MLLKWDDSPEEWGVLYNVELQILCFLIYIVLLKSRKANLWICSAHGIHANGIWFSNQETRKTGA